MEVEVTWTEMRVACKLFVSFTIGRNVARINSTTLMMAIRLTLASSGRSVIVSYLRSPWCTKPSIMFSLVESIRTNTKSWVDVVFYLYIHNQHSE